MPPRLNKRQQREQEELVALGGPSNMAEESDGDDVVPAPIRPPGAGFSALLSPDEPEEESEEDSPIQTTKAKKSKKKKKKKDSNVGVLDRTSVSTPGTPESPANTKSKKEKAANKKGKEKDNDLDDLDRALEELSIKYTGLRHVSTARTPSSGSNASSLAPLLSVSLPHLDSEAEMRKFFGSKVVTANKASSNVLSTKRKAATQRSNLTRPQPTWWPATQREGLSIRAMTQEELEAKSTSQPWGISELERWWTVEYSKKYKSVTLTFMRTVMSGDPEGFWRLLGKLPWHADTLLQLSEVYRHREEYSQAVDFVERALFTYERAFVGAFKITGGLNRLDFRYVENRPFFLALHRQITDLQRRGCVRTAFEFARLLYSLDPWSDPHGALLHLDYLAPKSGMGQWFLDLWDHFTDKNGEPKLEYLGRMNPCLLPGCTYARALVLRLQEDTKKGPTHGASTLALKHAIQTFPSVVPLLADKADIPLSSDIRKQFRIHTDGNDLSATEGGLELLAHLYAQRSSSLWKDSNISKWFANTVAETVKLPHITASSKKFTQLFDDTTILYSVYRHIMVLESTYRRLFSFIPRSVLDVKQLACDPLPPPNKVNAYDQDFFQGIDDVFSARSRTRRDEQADARLLERLIPNAAFREQLQAVFNAHPQLMERFDGIVHFARMAAEFPEDILDDVMAAEVIGGNDQQVMPGDIFFADGGPQPEPQPAPRGAVDDVEGNDGEPRNDEEGDNEGDDDEEDDDEYIAPMPIRVVRNILNRLWGRANAAEESSDEGEDIGTPVIDNSEVD